MPMEVERSSGCGGTDVAAIVGEHRYRSVYDVWLEKVGLVEQQDGWPSREAHWGSHSEPILASWYRDVLRGGNITLKGTPGSLRHPERPWQTGTPDDLVVEEPIGVEYKTGGVYQISRWGPPGTDQIPSEYLIQVQWYMSLLDLDEWHVVATIGGRPGDLWIVERDRRLERVLLQRVERFWEDHVVPRVPPEIDGSKGAAAMVDAMHASHGDDIREPTDEESEMVESLMSVREEIEQAAVEEERIKSRIKSRIGSAKGIESDDFKVTWSTAKGKRSIDWQGLLNELEVEVDPETLKRHTKIGQPARRFLVKRKEEK